MINILFASLLVFAQTDPVRQCLDDLRRKKHDKHPEMEFTFHPVTAAKLPLTCVRGDLAQIRTALQRQIDNCKGPTKAASGTHDIACRRVQRDEWCLHTNEEMLKIANSANDVASFMKTISTRFDWYQSDGFPADQFDKKGKLTFKKGQNQFTAYDSPIHAAQDKPRGDYTYPVYDKPDNLVEIPEASPANCGHNDVSGDPIHWCLQQGGSYVPVPVRADINAGKLPGVKIVAYMKGRDLADLEMEGAGFLDIADAKGVKHHTPVTFNAQNGQPASYLNDILDCLQPPPANKKKYLDSLTPQQLRHLLEYDRAYIFFTPKTPEGSENIPLTPMVSLATDQTNVRIGTAVLLNTVTPKGVNNGCANSTALGIAQDGGGLILGPHTDMYMGEGPDARKSSGSINNAGSYFIALIPGAGAPIPGCN